MTKDQGEIRLKVRPQPILVIDVIGDVKFKYFLVDVCCIRFQACWWLDGLLSLPLERPQKISTVGVLLPYVLSNLTLNIREAIRSRIGWVKDENTALEATARPVKLGCGQCCTQWCLRRDRNPWLLFVLVTSRCYPPFSPRLTEWHLVPPSPYWPWSQCRK